eukprot:RCo042186
MYVCGQYLLVLLRLRGVCACAVVPVLAWAAVVWLLLGGNGFGFSRNLCREALCSQLLMLCRLVVSPLDFRFVRREEGVAGWCSSTSQEAVLTRAPSTLFSFFLREMKGENAQRVFSATIFVAFAALLTGGEVCLVRVECGGLVCRRAVTFS